MGKLQIKRGEKKKLPHLAEGELGFTTDENKVYIGTAKGNISISSVRPERIETIMRADGWDIDTKTYSFETRYPHSQFDIEIAYAKTCTPEQLSAWNDAILAGDITLNIVTALGDMPTVDIPIIIEGVRI